MFLEMIIQIVGDIDLCQLAKLQVEKLLEKRHLEEKLLVGKHQEKKHHVERHQGKLQESKHLVSIVYESYS